MNPSAIQLTQNHGGPLHYLGNRYLTLPDLTGHMSPDTSWLNEHFSVLLANNKGQKYKKAIEPFAGSASWSMAAMEVGLAEKYIINDSNKILIHTLQLIRDNPALIKASYAALIEKYNVSISKKDFFLEVIENYNQTTEHEEKSLILPFIINHSWGGILFYDKELNIIYREGELFEGKNANRFLEHANLSLEMFLSEIDRVSNLLNANQVSFRSGDFMEVISSAAPGDFVALNPPYPENEHSTFKKAGMYIELYSPEKLHQNLVHIIQHFESQGIHYYMTYGFYNPKFKNYVLTNENQQPINYFRVLGYEHCAFGIGLDQMYFTSQFSIPKGINIFKAEEVLGTQDITPEEALEQFKLLSKKCFAVIYRAFIKPGLEIEYQKAWHQVASYFVTYRGALGSCLHKTNDGMWLAYSRWPDKATRDASWPGDNAPSEMLPNEIRKAVITIQESIDQTQKLPEITMEVVNDLLYSN
ncbi:TPA: DNA adenine methylase [Legionella pneumophila]|uniref:site-specific DNA-methyltransferase (adenine-specific) n=2 Tax=Legionellaceae TaxID=444 RepID=A0A377GB34_9GAMM|nr:MULTISPECIES: DNA adenine methylase [Legionellaceae]HAT9631454.1 DNA adenine methylase [Legionella pneumophila subsp. pneumophila]KTC90451.1 Modification methylase DpnIIA [Fluoribacter dumoffii NY 23]KTD68943.1 Modification methylase DpnIIA [Legionella steelei]MCW8483205.1 DNA adenine methylase [Fluoribacter dumoffii]STO21944.1 Modification methylase DpnIIA [Fluoribacter dumoffii]